MWPDKSAGANTGYAESVFAAVFFGLAGVTIGMAQPLVVRPRRALLFMNILCPKCGGQTVRGDLRTGSGTILSMGVEFVADDDSDQRWTPAVRNDHRRVISFACQSCGLVSSFLERVVRLSSTI